MADPVLVLTRLGGVATWRALRCGSSWREIRRAVDAGGVVRVTRGRYALPLADEARVAGTRLTGTVSHTSAAVHWGWAVARTPAEPHVTVSPRRHIAAARREGVRVHWRMLDPSEICDGWVTSPVRTVIDCCLDLPFDEAVALVDSSWRAALKPREVQLAALRLPRRQRDRVLAVVRAADPRAANPFESVLRVIALGVKGLELDPQLAIQDSGFYARVDLADEALKIVVEADSFEFHSSPKHLDRDVRRYNGLVVRGWLVLRFTWKQVMFEPDFVRATLAAAVELRRGPGRSTGAKRRTVGKAG